MHYFVITLQEPEDSELTDEHESPHPDDQVPGYSQQGVTSPQQGDKEKQPAQQNQEAPPKPHVQNNQVNTSQPQQPIPPSNQINNQLNNQQQQQQQQPDTGEEENSSNSNNRSSPTE